MCNVTEFESFSCRCCMNIVFVCFRSFYSRVKLIYAHSVFCWFFGETFCFHLHASEVALSRKRRLIYTVTAQKTVNYMNFFYICNFCLEKLVHFIHLF
jgi:hypothetical protein